MVSVEKAEKVLEALRSNGMNIGSVESFTGGLFASSLCAVPGASDTFKGALVAYDPALKTSLDDVPSDLIREYGVVSQEVASAMAKNGRKNLDVDVCVSFTGNAGPSVQEGGMPVGRCYMAIATAYGLVEVFQDLSGERNEIREKAVELIFDRLIAIFEK